VWPWLHHELGQEAVHHLEIGQRLLVADHRVVGEREHGPCKALATIAPSAPARALGSLVLIFIAVEGVIVHRARRRGPLKPECV